MRGEASVGSTRESKQFLLSAFLLFERVTTDSTHREVFSFPTRDDVGLVVCMALMGRLGWVFASVFVPYFVLLFPFHVFPRGSHDMSGKSRRRRWRASWLELVAFLFSLRTSSR